MIRYLYKIFYILQKNKNKKKSIMSHEQVNVNSSFI